MKASDYKMVWFFRQTMLSQSIFSFPMIGFITGYQAIVIFGIGLILFFGILQATGDIASAAIPFLVVIGFAMIRPPLMSYEARLWAIIRFQMRGGYGKKKKKAKKPKSKVLSKSSKFLKHPEKITEQPRELAPQEPMYVHVVPGAPVEISITLKTRNNTVIGSKKVRILLDGHPIKTAISSSTGKLTILLDSDECTGKNIISVCEVGDDDVTGQLLIERDIIFEAEK